MRVVRLMGKRFPAMVMVVAALWALVWVDGYAQDGKLSNQAIIRHEGWLTPPKIIADAVLASQPEDKVAYNNMCPDGKKLLLVKSDGMPTADRMGRPCVHLAEMAFDHTAYRSHMLYVKSNAGYELYFHADKKKVPVELPEGMRVSNAAWSPDGGQLAFFGHALQATHIFIADTTTGKTRQLTKTPVLATMVTSFQWTRDGKRIQTVLMPDDAASKVGAHAVASGPKVRVTEDRKAPSRTIRYLLETAEDMQLLEHLITGQLAFVDVATGAVTKVGSPNMLQTVSMSPGGESFRITTVKKPFSYYVAATAFGSTECIWNLEGKNVYTFSDKGLKDGKGGGGAKGGKGGKKGGVQPPQPDPDPDKKGDDQPPVDPDAKREVGWRPDGVGMTYLQLEPVKKAAKKDAAKKDADQKDADKKDADKKDAAKETKEPPRKDRVMHWTAPYGPRDVKIVYETPNRIATANYSDDCSMLFVTETVDNQQQIIAVDLKDGNKSYTIKKGLAAGGGGKGEDLDSPFTPPDDDYIYDDDYYHGEQQKKGGKGGKGGGGGGAAGGLMTRANKGAAKVVTISTAGDVYIAGTEKGGGGGGKPYIDKINIKTGEKTRIFAGKSDMSETIDSVNGDDISVVFTTRQKKTVAPNSYRIDLTTGKEERLTENVDHTPWFHTLKTERFKVKREDGFEFWVKVTKAPDAKERLPAIFWIYPKEFVSQAAYDKGGKAGGAGGGGGKGGGDAKFATPGPRSMTIVTLLNYVLVEPDVPIVGPAGKMNDNYVKDLASSLKATVEELDKRNIIDPDRLACGGHSYGAFSTANALAHTKLFKAGIAGDGCYNRTLTPMTFQTEKRSIWDARDTYLAMSPLLHADKMSGALLMYHGMWDRNVGTNPMNSDHLYAALRGLGKPAALYMYPYEDHGPIGRETQLDMWARWVAWLDTYVTNAPPKKQ